MEEAEASITKASDEGTHCNMGMAVAWDGKSQVTFHVLDLGGKGTSDRPVLAVAIDNVCYFDLHLTSGSGAGRAREQELDALLRHMAKYRQCAAMGDYNQSPATTKEMLANPRGAGFHVVHTDDYTQKSGGVYDYCVCRNLTLSSASRVSTLVSDHWGVFFS
jgi:hypothetical protein